MENQTTPRKAPRVPPGRDSLAVAAQRASRKQALAYFADHIDYRGFPVFDGADDRFAVDRCAQYFSQASCMLSMLSSGFADAREMGDGSEFGNRNPSIVEGALEAVRTLINLGTFLLDDPSPLGEA